MEFCGSKLLQSASTRQIQIPLAKPGTGHPDTRSHCHVCMKSSESMEEL